MPPELHLKSNAESKIASLEKASPQRRLRELDALRGLAALAVVFGHASNLYAKPTEHPAFPTVSFLLEKIKLTPFFALLSAHEAVILFYLLSGFVLSLPFLAGKGATYKVFVLRRIFRIYVPYLIALILSIGACAWLSKYGIPWLSPWFNGSWTKPITTQSVLSHVMLLGRFDTLQYNSAIWSLVHEMRISLLFPFVVIPIIPRWKMALCIAMLLSITGICLDFFLKGGETNFGLTLHYMGLFILGGVLANNLLCIKQSWQKMQISAKWLIFFLAAFCYLYGRSTKFFCGKVAVFDWIIATGAVGLIAIALSSQRANRLLCSGIPQWLGRISYSLYLTHLIVVFGIVNTFADTFPLWALVLSIPPIALLVAWFFCILVEEPAHRIGLHLTKSRNVTRAI